MMASPIALGAAPAKGAESGGVMTTTTSVRPHGTAARYNHGPDHDGRPGKGCRCADCGAAARRVRKRNRLAALNGRNHARVDAGPVREHILTLCEAGMSRQEIARRAGVVPGLLSRLVLGDARTGKPARRMRADNAAAILAVRPAADAALLVPAVGTRRRLQGLAWHGWPPAQVGRRVGLAPAHVWRIAAGLTGGRVLAETACRVEAACRRLWGVSPADAGVEPWRVTLTRERAVERGWVSLLAWDDIDDPDARPQGLKRVRR
jgi:transcriptional regulator with XRE-family HTH domain